MRRRFLLAGTGQQALSQIDNFKTQAINAGAVINTDALDIYAALDKSMVSRPGAITFVPYAYKANIVYGMDTAGNLVAINQTRASNATYTDRTGKLVNASNGMPRFGYDPTTLAYLGLMEEQAGTNLYLNADPTGPENSTGGEITYSAYTWPHTSIISHAINYAGTTASGEWHYGGTCPASTLMCFSMFVIMSDNSVPVIGASTNASADFSIVIGGAQATFIAPPVSCGNGVYLVWGTATSPAGPSGLGSNGLVKYPTQSHKAFKSDWPQLETGGYPTSRIFTSGATATRTKDTFVTNADYLSDTGGSVFMYTALKKIGTVTTQYFNRGTGSNGRVYYSVNTDDTVVGYGAYDGTNTVSAAGTVPAGQFHKALTSWGSNGLRVVRNGGTVAGTTYDGTMGEGGGTVFGGPTSATVGFMYILALVLIPSQVSDSEAQTYTS